MKAKTLMLLVALLLVPAVGAAAEEGKAGAAAVPTSLDGAGPKSQTAAPEKPGLDVSRMPFDPQSIREVVRFHMPEIQECYEKVLSDTGARIEGRVMVGFTIDLEGNVADLKPLPKKSSVKDDRVVDCVILAVRRWAFPKPSDNRIYPIEYPFDLKISDVKETKATAKDIK